MRLTPILLTATMLGLSQARAAPAVTPREIVTSERSVHLECVNATGEGPHPTALLLHGASGFGRQVEAYRHIAGEIADAGIDACLLDYYSDDDQRRLEAGDTIFGARYPAWARLVDEVADSIARSGGRVALVGFSNGAILASGAAARDPAIAAAVIYYGSVPWPMDTPVRRFPPLLVLHGDADTVIPVSEGKALATMARKLGGEAELVVYPGGWHGFGTQWTTPDGADALARTIAFLRRAVMTPETTPASGRR
jgi:dienelactone hydrolase